MSSTNVQEIEIIKEMIDARMSLCYEIQKQMIVSISLSTVTLIVGLVILVTK